MSINNISFFLERIDKTLQKIAKSLETLSACKKKPAASLPAGDNEKEEGES